MRKILTFLSILIVTPLVMMIILGLASTLGLPITTSVSISVVSFPFIMMGLIMTITRYAD